MKSFHLVVGTIITLADPLSALSLSRLLNVPPDVMSNRLRLLHSILNIPQDQESPIRLLHLSFREYLINRQQSRVNEFWIDEQLVHQRLTNDCMRIMDCHLREDIYSLQLPGTRRTDSHYIKEKVLPELEYACLHWVRHTTTKAPQPGDIQEIHRFLNQHLLHWLEVLCLIGRSTEGLSTLKMLRIYLEVCELSCPRKQI